MDQFDFDDIDDQVPKKPTNKKQQHKQPHKKVSNNKKDDDFFDLQQQIDSKPKSKQPKRNYPQADQQDSNDIDYKKQIKQKQKESKLPKINLPKSPRNNNSTTKNKMDLSLEDLPEKKTLNKQSQFKNKRKDSQLQNDEFAVHKQKVEKQLLKQQLKTNLTSKKQKNQSFKTIDKNIPSPKLTPKQSNHSQLFKKNKPIEQKKVQQKNNNDQDYEQQYEEEIFEDQIINEKNAKKYVQKREVPKEKKVGKNSSLLNNKPKQTQKATPISSKSQKPQPSSATEEKVNKYKQLVEKSFPSDQDEQKVQKLKADTINKLNQKMRDMIKGFSNQLTSMIDKNIFLLRKPQNQIKEQIEGQTDPVESQIKLLEEMKKNNLKVIQNSQKELQSIFKTNQKIQASTKSSAQMIEQIQEYKKQIAIISKEMVNLESDIERQSKKVTKIEENNNKNGVSQEFKDSKYKNILQITQKIEIHKLEFAKNKKKIAQLNQKLSQLQQKVAQTTQKRRRILQKAQNEGISFYTKEQKKIYDDLKKKRDQYQLFESKFKSSIKSKEAVIQHEMTDYEVVIAEYERKYQILNEQVEKSQEKIFSQIRKAKKNPRLHSNTKEILTQLETFMSDDNPSQSQEDLNSLNFISQKIYKKEYQGKVHSKTLTDEKANKKPDYKNYLQQVARQNEQARNKSKTVRKVSEQNPFRKAITPSETVQALKIEQKKGKSKQAPELQIQRQKQRIWKSSNTQALIRNPLKKQHQQNQKSRYEQKTQQQQSNPLQNKQLIKLINHQKQKINLKEEEKNLSRLKQQQPLTVNKKPFGIRIGGVKQQSEQLNELADISKQMEKIGKEIETHRSSLKRESKMDMNEEDQQQGKMEMKSSVVNTTPFKNLKLKKDKDKQKDTNNNQQFQIKLPTEQSKPLSQQLNHPLEQDPVLFKPKRFNLRKRNQNQNQNQSYLPSARVVENNSQMIGSKKSQNKLNPSISLQYNQNIQKNEIQVGNKTKQEDAFDPFKKFMANQINDDKSISLNIEIKKEPLKLDDDKVMGENINNKPKINLFKKAVGENEKDKKLTLLGDENKAQEVNDKKIFNPYAQMNNQKQPQVPKIQRQGRLKRMNLPPNNLAKPTNHNIFADVEDATINANIQILGDPEPVRRETEPDVPKFTNKNDKELNVNDLLGIKKRNFQVDRDLLIDLPDDNKVSVKAKARGKGGDFFGDLDL